MKLVNLTPHELRIRLDASTAAEPLETDLVIPPTAPACRIAQSSVPVQPINVTRSEYDIKIFRELDIPVKKAVFGQIENLPEPQVGVVYIVSLPVAQNAHRADVVSPDTSPAGGAVRVANGQIFAVRGFQQFD